MTVTFDEVMMMAKAIDRGSQYGMRMVDMPYWSFHVSPEQAVENDGRFVHEANAEVMKWFRTNLTIETKSDQSPVTIADLVERRIGGIIVPVKYLQCLRPEHF